MQADDKNNDNQTMSRLVATVYSCDSCSREYSLVEDSFIDFSGLRKWSDGWAWGTYYNLRSALRLCPCGMLFWPNGTCFKVYNAEPYKIVKHEPDPDPDSELLGNSKSRSWFRGLLRAKTRADDIGERIRPIQSIIQVDIIHPVNIAGLYDTLSCDDVSFDHATEIEIRKWLWWLWNHPNRANPLAHIDHGPSTTEEKIKSNLSKLLKLIENISDFERQKYMSWMMIGDAFRRLGRFDEAVSAYAHMEDDRIVRDVLINLANRNRKECIEITKPIPSIDNHL
jgi:pentatricopeptide repeat protein